MIQRVISKRHLTDNSVRDDVAYWRSRPASERIAAVENLRRQHHGRTTRLQRSARVIERAQG
jgi:hypothetical protein